MDSEGREPPRLLGGFATDADSDEGAAENRYEGDDQERDEENEDGQTAMIEGHATTVEQLSRQYLQHIMDIRIQEVEHSYRQQNLVEKSAFIQHSPASKKALMKAGLARSEEGRRLLLKLLLSLQEFAKFPDLVRTELTKMVTMRDVKEGEIVFEQGSYGSAWYTILSGSCNVYMEQEGKREQVSRMLAGSSFGEKALVQSPKRTATVIAAEKTELPVVERDDYLKTVKIPPLLPF